MQYRLSEFLVTEISRFARKHDIERIILFGSRARGTNSPRSDIDIAVSGGDVDRFSIDISENADTLLMFDIVPLDYGITDELRNEIDRDGVIIYEKDG